MRSLKFRYLDRGQKETLCVIPGWGFDCRIFRPLNLKYNYLLPERPNLAAFKYDLRDELEKEKIDEVSLFGWSMGGFLAVDFACEYFHLVKEIFLISVRKEYPQDEISLMKSLLKENKKVLLYRFYQECFFPEKKAFFWFKENLLRAYLEEMDQGFLSEGLDYLAQAKLAAEALKGKCVRFLHGSKDKVAPLKEVEELKGELSKARLVVLDHTGHIPFLGSKFEEIFHAE